MRILLVEDEHDAARMLARGLRENGYAVDIAPDGISALDKAAINEYDLLILDVMLPGASGLSVCAELRKRGLDAPILMLTALDAINDRIAGLDSGADDYLTKPFDFGELLARVRALLRRGPALEDPVIVIRDLEIDTRSHGVRRGGRPIDLTAKEFALLEFLARRRGQVVGREAISEHVWDEEYDPFSNLIEVYIQRLRHKLGDHAEPHLIRTRRGEGYQFAPEEEP